MYNEQSCSFAVHEKEHKKTVVYYIICNLVPRLSALLEAKTLVEAGHVSHGFRVINLKYTVGGVVKERVFLV